METPGQWPVGAMGICKEWHPGVSVTGGAHGFAAQTVSVGNRQIARLRHVSHRGFQPSTPGNLFLGISLAPGHDLSSPIHVSAMNEAPSHC